jgi:hypothetical protein
MIMPRPKVSSGDRQRSERACNACKSSKIRCDSQMPCETCVRRKRPQYCTYTHVDRRRRCHQNIVGNEPLGSLPGAAEGQLVDATSCASAALRQHRNEASPPPTPVDVATSSSAELHASPESQSLDALAKDTDEYRGEPISHQLPSAELRNIDSSCEPTSLSFLYFLRKTLRPFVGSTTFTDNDHEYTLSTTDPTPVVAQTSDVPLEKLGVFLDSYLQAVRAVRREFVSHGHC